MSFEPPPLWTAHQAAAADRYTIEQLGVPSPVLMERASLVVAAEVASAVSQVAASREHATAEVWVLVGPGNNGGDGLAVARILHGRNMAVRVFLVTSRRGRQAQQQLEMVQRMGIPVQRGVPPQDDSTEARRGPAVVVDAMLGTGSQGAPRGEIAEGIAWLDRQVGVGVGPGPGPVVVAVDMPSGIDPDTGQCLGQTAVRAHRTVTFQRSKPGLHVTPGRDHAGTVVEADIGIVADPDVESSSHVEVRLSQPETVRRALANLDSVTTAAHKGQRGHVGLVAGGVQTPGAAILAAKAAFRAGAGLVTARLAGAGGATPLLAAQPEVMVELDQGHDPNHALLARATGLVVGPGLTDAGSGGSTLDLGTLWRDDPRPAVWDASALDFIEGRALALRVITPHPGEAARLLSRVESNPWRVADVQGRRLEAASRLAAIFGAICVLKGAGTLVAAPSGEVWVDGVGGPELATAGSGDVLAGLLGALVARRPRASTETSDLVVISAGVWAHGVAGRIALDQRPTPTAGDVAQACDRALDRMRRQPDAGAPWALVERRWG